MKPSDIRFAVHDYDSDGDILERGIFLCFGGTRVKAAETLHQFKTIVEHFEQMIAEIQDNYPNA